MLHLTKKFHLQKEINLAKAKLQQKMLLNPQLPQQKKQQTLFHQSLQVLASEILSTWII